MLYHIDVLFLLINLQKFRVVRNAKVVIGLNGIVFTSVGIASLLPGVRNYMTGGKGSELDINAPVLAGSMIYIGVSNLFSLLSLDVMSCLQQLHSNIVGYGIFTAIGAYYGYKFNKTNSFGINNPYNQKMLYFAGAIAASQVLSSLIAIGGIHTAYPTTTLYVYHILYHVS